MSPEARGILSRPGRVFPSVATVPNGSESATEGQFYLGREKGSDRFERIATDGTVQDKCKTERVGRDSGRGLATGNYKNAHQQRSRLVEERREASPHEAALAPHGARQGGVWGHVADVPIRLVRAPTDQRFRSPTLEGGLI